MSEIVTQWADELTIENFSAVVLDLQLPWQATLVTPGDIPVEKTVACWSIHPEWVHDILLSRDITDIAEMNFILLHELGHAVHSEFAGIDGGRYCELSEADEERFEQDADDFGWMFCRQVKLIEEA